MAFLTFLLRCISIRSLGQRDNRFLRVRHAVDFVFVFVSDCCCDLFRACQLEGRA